MKRLVPFGLMAVILTLGARPVGAAPWGMGGFDGYRGPGGRETRSVLAVAGFSTAGGDALGGALRFDDDVVGSGYGLLLGGGLPLGGPTTLRVLATRFVGEHGYRAWRWRTGPRWTLPGGGALGVYWVRDVNNLGPDTDGGVGELSVPLAGHWTGRLTGSFGRSGDMTGYAASTGAAWSAIPHVEIGGELGLAKNPPATTPAPSGGLLSPVLGPGPPPPHESTEAIESTALLSLRLTFP